MAELPTSDLRARRFPLRFALQYRGDATADWHAATTENISLSGVLFQAKHPLPLHTPVELTFRLPKLLSGRTPVRVIGTAYVVRATASRPGNGHSRIAASFLQFRFADTGAAKPRVQPPLYAGTQHKLYNMLEVILGTCELLLDRGDLAVDVRAGISRIQDAAMSTAAGVRRLPL